MKASKASGMVLLNARYHADPFCRQFAASQWHPFFLRGLKTTKTCQRDPKLSPKKIPDMFVEKKHLVILFPWNSHPNTWIFWGSQGLGIVKYPSFGLVLQRHPHLRCGWLMWSSRCVDDCMLHAFNTLFRPIRVYIYIYVSIFMYYIHTYRSWWSSMFQYQKWQRSGKSVQIHHDTVRNGTPPTWYGCNKETYNIQWFNCLCIYWITISPLWSCQQHDKAMRLDGFFEFRFIP